MTTQPSGPALQAIPDMERSIESLYNTVAALVQNVRHLSGQSPAPPKTPPKPNAPKPQQEKSKKQANGRFSEVTRATQTVKIENPQDSTQYVMVKQITRLVLQDNVTGETWEWTL